MGVTNKMLEEFYFKVVGSQCYNNRQGLCEKKTCVKFTALGSSEALRQK